jgi:hypothetical protein
MAHELYRQWGTMEFPGANHHMIPDSAGVLFSVGFARL